MKRIAERAIEILGGCIGLRVWEHWVADRVLWIVVEVSGADVLSRAMQGFGVRVARGVNGLRGTHGRVLADRYELVVPLTKAWGERADGIVRGAAKSIWNAAGLVKNEWMNPEERDRALDGGRPLVALGKALGLFALAVATARPGPSVLGGIGNKYERKRFHIEQENRHVRAWREKRRREVANDERTDERRHDRVTRWWIAWAQGEIAAGRPWQEVVAERDEKERIEHEKIDDGTWRPRRKKRART